MQPGTNLTYLCSSRATILSNHCIAMTDGNFLSTARCESPSRDRELTRDHDSSSLDARQGASRRRFQRSDNSAWSTLRCGFVSGSLLPSPRPAWECRPLGPQSDLRPARQQDGARPGLTFSAQGLSLVSIEQIGAFPERACLDSMVIH